MDIEKLEKKIKESEQYIEQAYEELWAYIQIQRKGKNLLEELKNGKPQPAKMNYIKIFEYLIDGFDYNYSVVKWNNKDNGLSRLKDGQMLLAYYENPIELEGKKRCIFTLKWNAIDKKLISMDYKKDMPTPDFWVKFDIPK